MSTLDRVQQLLEVISKIDAKHGEGFSFDSYGDEQIVFGVGTDRAIKAKHLREARALLPELRLLQEEAANRQWGAQDGQ